jgi:DMSO/TMAO reductase YedYZ molybdopterin-dependent catalytic subunit
LPAAKALDDVLLAYEMNGEALPPDHGFPVRLVVPGWVGIASVKWLGRIEVAARPLRSPWSTIWYRMTGHGHPADAPPLAHQDVKSAFELAWDALVPARVPLTLRGRSWSGRFPIRRVDVSADGGASWSPARLVEPNQAGAWVRWELDWTPSAPGRYELRARATDAGGRVQPFEVPLNDNGYMFWAVVRHPVVAVA